jgi:malate synthase
MEPGFPQILTSEALEFVGDLERRFGERRRELMARRIEVQKQLDAGAIPEFLPETADIRSSDWRVAPVPEILHDRRVEITGPVDRKMMINALNSGANVFMADLEDASSPTWENVVRGQQNLIDAIGGTLEFTSPDGKEYRLQENAATLFVRPRGWHLTEKHVQVDQQPISASLFDFGLYFFHNAQKLASRHQGPFFYLPKMESHLEARLWNDVFCHAQESLGLARGTIKATCLVESILAVYEMEEILWELRDHSAGLNAGRWDYIFSVIKKFRKRPEALLPDRAQITMTTGFMRAYSELLVRTCHKRGAFAIGGMAAFIPSRKDPEVNQRALAKIREDKERESGDGFDGTWIAHPDLVAPVKEIFDRVLGQRQNQLDVLREDVEVEAQDLVDFTIADGRITENGVRKNISVALIYLESWLRGAGAVGIYNLMEDTATAEISRSQLWQWVHSSSARLEDDREITVELYQRLVSEELDKIRSFFGTEVFDRSRYADARQLLDTLVLAEEIPDFLTWDAYELL